MNCLPNIAETCSISTRSGVTENRVRSAMLAARLAQVRWSAKPLRERLVHIREMRALIAENASTLAEASASARCRPTRESLTAEVLPLAEACRFMEREAPACLAPRRLGKHRLPIWLSGVRTEIHREPLGVALIIGPGNYPLFLPGVQIVQALVAGNAVLLKPGVGGSSAARAFVDLMQRAGFDPHLMALLPESTEAAAAAIDSKPDKVVFTGSAAAGEKVLAQLAPRLIPATMELSGCDAFIVRADADLELVVKCLAFGLELNAGATCMAPRRVLLHRAIATEVEQRLAKAFPPAAPFSLPANDPPFTDFGPAARLRELLVEAVAEGAHFVTGGVSPDGTIKFPIILGCVAPSSRLLREDVFAPVMSLVSVVDDAEAIAHANDCPYALGASVFSRDEPAARTIAKAVNAGIVTINDLIVPSADARVPFGGRGGSGFGVTRGSEGLLEFTVAKVVSVSRATFRPAFEPPHPQDEMIFGSYLQLIHARRFRRRVRALVSIVKSLSTRKKQTTHKFL